MVGSGPAGLYAADALVASGDVAVDVLDRLPCPFGLVRYGVAPDHPKIKSIAAALRPVLEDPAVRFLGNVEVGEDVTLEELHQHYDAILLANGAPADRRLGIAGEDLPGFYSAREFVDWYSGHPDAAAGPFHLGARTVAVIGAGNVALDVSRMLARTAAELSQTDAPQDVLRALDRSAVEDIHIVVRRGPVQAKFTTNELRELGRLADAAVMVDPADLELDDPSHAQLAQSPGARRNLDVLRDWASRSPDGRARRVHLHFKLRPVEVLGDSAVTGLRVERTRLLPDGTADGTGSTYDLGAQMVLRSVGYRGRPMPGVPFDEASGVVPNVAGRVVEDGLAVPGVYVAGWIKRGPTGVIGTNKRDARETVAALLEDVPTLTRAPVRDPEELPRLLRERGVTPVTWRGWCAIEEAEAALGRSRGRAATKIAGREDLLAAARSL